MRLFIVFTIVCFSFFNVHAQLSKTHYIPPITYPSVSSGNPNNQSEEVEGQYLYISTPSSSPVTVYIKKYNGNIIDVIDFRDINRTSHWEFDTSFVSDKDDINSSYVMEHAYNSFSNKGLIVEASSPVFVSLRIDGDAQATSVVSKGVSAKGTIFRAGGFTNLKNFNGNNNNYKFQSFISVMATEDNTNLSFNDIDTAVVFESTTHNNNVTLKKGQSYLVTVKSYKPGNLVNRDALLGALVNADKPVVVNCGSFSGSSDDNNLTSNSRDAGIDQIVPLERVGKEYLFIRAQGEDENERPLIVAHEDNTEVFLNGATSANRILNAGEYWSIPGTEYSSFTEGSHMFVKTSKKVFAYQAIGSIGNSGSPSSANVELFFVPPINDDTPCSVDYIPNGSRIGAKLYDDTGKVVIIAEQAANVKLNGNSLPGAGGQLITGTSFVNYIESIPLSDDINVSSDSQVYVYYYASNGPASYGGYYSGFTADSQVGFQDVSSNVTCEGGILELQNVGEYADFYDTYEWFFDDDLNDLNPEVSISGGPQPLNTTTDTKITATNVGYYFVKVEASSGSGCNQSFESNKFPVASCPNDFDGDSVIDNIDQDFDNDGILNITESSVLPIDVTGFSLNQENNVSTNAVNSSSLEQLTFSVTDDGDPETKGSAAAKFLLTGTNQSLLVDNFQNYDDGDIIHIDVPNDQLVSVYDPDGQLQFDSNYDGKYEESELTVTSFDVRFRVNINSGVSPTFNIRSKELDQITITYLYAGTGTNNITLSFSELYGLDDFDSDGVINVLDIDTDNDGIYDLIESGNYRLDLDSNGTLETFLDLNFDGVIDATLFVDSNGDGFHDDTINPIDTDNDTVPNYLDTDSDGDTISDLIEGGNYRLDLDGDGTLDDVDLNFDGVIDAALFTDTADNDGFHDAANSVPLNSDFNNDSTDIIPDNDDDFPDYIDLDSDNDGCADQLERGNPTTNLLPLDNNGDSIFDFQFYANVVASSLQDELVLCELSDDVLSVTLDTNSFNYDTVIWQLNDGSGWVDIPVTSTSFQNTNTPNLKITNVQLADDGLLLKAKFYRDDYVCSAWESEQVLLKVNNLPEVLTSWSGELIQCDDDTDGLSVFNLLEVRESLSVNYPNETFEFYTDINDLSTLILDPTNFNNSVANQIIQVKIIDASGCSIVENIVLKAISNSLPNSLSQQTYKVCYDYTDNKTTFDFSSIEDPSSPGTYITFDDYILNAYTDGILRQVTYYGSYNDALIEKDSITNLSAFEVDGLSEGGIVTIWVRVDDQLINSCNGIKDLIQLQVLPDTSFEIDPNILNPLNPTENELVICNTVSETIQLLLNTAVNLSNLEFEWTFPDGSTDITSLPENNVSDEGLYSVSAYNVLNKTCEFSDIFKVSRYTINEPQISFFDITSGTKRNVIRLKDISDESVFGPNNYEFKLIDEDGNDVNSNFIEFCEFKDLTGGFYTLVIRDEAQCDEKSIVIPILYFPTFITPNGDGYNDTWEVKGIDLSDYNLQLTKLYIFDRYGKLIGSLDLDQSWDGTFNGTPLEATDYWYKVDLVKKSGEVLQPIRGHFSLLK